MTTAATSTPAPPTLATPPLPVRQVSRRARRYEPVAAPAPVIPLRTQEPPVDAVHEFPDVVGETHEPAPLLVQPEIDEDDPEPLLLQAAPAGAVGSGEDVGTGVQRRQPVVGDPAEEAHRRAPARCQALEALPVPAGSGHGQGSDASRP